MNIEELYIDFCNNFKKVSTLTQNSSSPEWTKNIYDYFYNLGKENSFRVYAKPNVIKDGEREYLVDLCWSQEEGTEYQDYKGLDLILESEWETKKDEIMWDFCKLVDIKSFLKIMILCVLREEFDVILQEMLEAINASRIKFKEENYLVIVFVPIPSIYNPQRYIIEGYKINNEGLETKLQSVDFIFS